MTLVKVTLVEAKHGFRNFQQNMNVKWNCAATFLTNHIIDFVLRSPTNIDMGNPYWCPPQLGYRCSS